MYIRGQKGVKKTSNDEPTSPITLREKLSIIMIMTNQKKDHQHKKCINNTKRKIHEHHDHHEPRKKISTHEVHE